MMAQSLNDFFAERTTRKMIFKLYHGGKKGLLLPYEFQTIIDT